MSNSGFMVWVLPIACLGLGWRFARQIPPPALAPPWHSICTQCHTQHSRSAQAIVGLNLPGFKVLGCHHHDSACLASVFTSPYVCTSLLSKAVLLLAHQFLQLSFKIFCKLPSWNWRFGHFELPTGANTRHAKHDEGRSVHCPSLPQLATHEVCTDPPLRTKHPTLSSLLQRPFSWEVTSCCK